MVTSKIITEMPGRARKDMQRAADLGDQKAEEIIKAGKRY